MKLKDLLKDRFVNIECRIYHPNFGNVFLGVCMWNGSELISTGNRTYSTEDDIENYEYIKNNDGTPDDLTVWYKSCSITA